MPIDDNEYTAAGVTIDPTGPFDSADPVDRIQGRPSAGIPGAPGVEFSDGDQPYKDTDPTVAALQAMGRALDELARAKQLPPEPLVLARRKFRIVCMDVLGHLYTDDEATRLADTLIGGVYSGHLGYKQLRAYVWREQNKLTEEQRQFALGLCVGFMVDYLPRVRG